jgi:CTD small phosphatase-like protein 2
MSEYWDIYVYTASTSSYANAIVNFLDPDGSLILGILNRSNCMETKNGFFIKDLRILKGKSLEKTVIVDNLSHSFGF